jgi:hypothetical protein
MKNLNVYLATKVNDQLAADYTCLLVDEEQTKFMMMNQKLLVDKESYDELEKILSEVKHCKLGDLVIYNPNSEDKHAQFVASLIQSTQDKSDETISDIKVLLDYIFKGVASVDEEMVDEIAAKYKVEI